MKRCLAAGLLILDDFAFRPYSQQETELLYALCDERLSEGSIMDWLVSGAVKVIVTSGRSYRKEGGRRQEIQALSA